MSEADDLKKKLDTSARGTGWSKATVSPLRAQLQEVVNGLELMREEMVKEHAKKLKVLEGMLHHQAASNPKYRVRKDVD